jgi:hypothetical protein
MGAMELGMVVGGVMGVILAVFRSRGAVVSVAVIGLVIVGLGVVAAMRPEATPAEISAAFVSGCEKGCARAGAPASVCSTRCDCVATKLQENRTPDEFSQFLHEANANPTPQLRAELERSARDCASGR